MRSQAHRPAAWKTEPVRKALAFYGPWWRTHRSMAFVPWQTAAYTEAYLLTTRSRSPSFVSEMNDWLCGLRYESLDPRHPIWLGGFMSWSDGKAVPTAPDIVVGVLCRGPGRGVPRGPRGGRPAAPQALQRGPGVVACSS